MRPAAQSNADAGALRCLRVACTSTRIEMPQRYLRLDMEEARSPTSPGGSPIRDWPGRAEARGDRVRMQRNILAGVVVVLLLLLGGQTTSHHRRRTSAASSRGIQARKPSTRFSSLGDGLWMPPSHSNWTLEDIETRWGMGIAGNVANDVDRRRLEVASSYSWRPEGNLAGFDSWRFVREMHNSQNGLIILGGE